ncbi:MAG TPA: glycoside hydrolase family 38 C-terminal domain-containing protein, partial [Armatimonadota bacterium]|nr:glycoside hydrolase family 38 C-terminal domain-containing protein [Armatimonadota bacterium]
RVENTALQALASQVDTRGEGRPLLLFNPLPRARRELVEVQWNGAEPGHLVDAEGADVPFQHLQPTMFGGGSRIAFIADLPAGGYHCYRWAPGEAKVEASNDCPQAGEYSLENALWRLEFDPATGYLSRLIDKKTGAVVIDGAACVPVVIDDPSDTWAHGWLRFEKEAGRFGDPCFTVVENGPERAMLRITQHWGNSTIRQEFALAREGREIGIRLEIDWHEQHRMLKYSVPAAFQKAALTAEIPGGTLARAAEGEEDPCYRWIALTGEASRADGTTLPYTLALLNDSKYGYSCQDTDMRMSLLRSPIACFHDPARPEPDKEYIFLDQGKQTVRLALVPGAGTWQKLDLAAAAEAMHHPPVSVFQYPHAGEWPAKRELLSVKPDNVSILAFKGAEEGPGLVLRLFETAGVSTEATVSLGERTLITSLGAHEIKTLWLHPQTGSGREVNLLEETQE